MFCLVFQIQAQQKEGKQYVIVDLNSELNITRERTPFNSVLVVFHVHFNKVYLSDDL